MHYINSGDADMLALSLVIVPSLAATATCDTMKPQSISTSWQFAGPGGYADFDDPLRLESAGAAQATARAPGKRLGKPKLPEFGL